ncbi:MAG: 50S ribosomal protein L35 [Gammaproteobacteria bacterium]
MPKMKTNKSVAKRFKKTGSGKLMHARAYCRHILTKKSADQKRRLRREPAVVRGGDAKRILQMAPYL